MKISILVITLFLTVSFALAALKSQKIDLGTPVVPFNLKGTDGNSYSADSFKNEKVLVLVVTCNHCPYARASWPVLVELQSEFKDKGVQFVGINPNDEIEYPEDNFDKMIEYREKYNINFPYLRDETQEVAKKLGAVCTPDIFVYDKERKLYYHGRINDNWQNPKEVKEHSLKNAIENLLNGNPPPEDQIPSMGCSIKWK